MDNVGFGHFYCWRHGFITSSDSGTLVITTMLSMGDDKPAAKNSASFGAWEKVFVAAVLLAAGGLAALQNRNPLRRLLPVSIIMLLMDLGII